MKRPSLFAVAALALALNASLACGSPADPASESASAASSVARIADGGGIDLDAKKAAVQALFNAKCAPCHTERASGGLLLLDFGATTVDVPATQLPAMNRITPGDRAESYLFHKLKGTHRDVGGTGNPMPPREALTAQEIERVGDLIDSL